MSLIKIFFDTFFRSFCDFKECASREQFWVSAFLWSLLFFLSAILMSVFEVADKIILLSLGLYVILSFLPLWGLLIRRLHDAGFSSRWIFLSLLPGGCFVILIFTLLPSDFNSRFIGYTKMSALEKTAKLILVSIIFTVSAFFVISVRKASDFLEFSSIGIYDESSIDKVISAAREGDCLAQYKLGEFYYKGIAVEKNRSAALFWFSQSANAGNKKAYKARKMFDLISKNNFPSDYESLIKTASSGNADAQYIIATMFDLGLGIEQDETTAQTWFDLAFDGYFRAAQNIANGEDQFKTGEMYFWGIGVKENKEEAAKWYRKAALLRNTDALFALAQMLENGIDVPEDINEAMRLYRRASAQGDMRAKVRLEKIEIGGLNSKDSFVAVDCGEDDLPKRRNIFGRGRNTVSLVKVKIFAKTD
jgi:TPR repeat protein